MAFTEFDRDITCNNDLIECVQEEGIAAFGGIERTFLRKHKRETLSLPLGDSKPIIAVWDSSIPL